MAMKLLFAASVLLATASAAPFPASTDAGGCRVEQITAAKPDEDGNFQFHGPSRAGRWILIGTNGGKAQEDETLARREDGDGGGGEGFG